MANLSAKAAELSETPDLILAGERETAVKRVADAGAAMPIGDRPDPRVRIRSEGCGC